MERVVRHEWVEMELAMVKEIDIIDSAFSHAPGMSWYNVPKLIKWVRGNPVRRPIRFFTDRNIGQVDNYPADVNVALLMEPRNLDDTGYSICLGKLQQFKYVLTYDTDFKQKLGDKGLFYPIGGCWIKPDQQAIHPKTELCSMIASAKNIAPGHRLRHEIAAKHPDKINLYGGGYRPVEFKAQALSPYMFSFAIENVKANDLFTEKIIDCFLTGTVPIYWGTSELYKYFGTRGVMEFTDAASAGEILDVLTPDLYHSLLPHIEYNFYEAMKYRVAEDWFFEKYTFLLG